MPKRRAATEPVITKTSESPANHGNTVLDKTPEVESTATIKTDARPSPSKRRRIAVKGEEIESTDPSGFRASRRKPVSRIKVKVGKKALDNTITPDRDNENKDRNTRKRRSKEEKQVESMPLAARTIGHKLYIGAHVSSAGGVHNAVSNSVHIGANAFALFLKPQRKWANPPLLDDNCSAFHNNCEQHSYHQGKHVVPHGSYLVNLAATNKARSEQAYESYLDDLQRCERLGIQLYNIHPGNTLSNDRPTAIAHLAMHINKAHKTTKTVITLLENMAAGGNVLGSTFEDLRDIINLVEDKSRIGVCIDTCHSFAAGYDLRSSVAFQSTMQHFEEIVGFKYLRALHLNDSKAPLGAHRDLHANIGTGFLGLRAFHNIVNDTRFEGIPLVLETPTEAKDENGMPLKDEKGKVVEDKGIWAREIKLLESLVGMKTDGDEFLVLEQSLARKGEPERKRLADQLLRKREKESKKVKSPQKAKGRKAEAKLDEEQLSSSESNMGD